MALMSKEEDTKSIPKTLLNSSSVPDSYLIQNGLYQWYQSLVFKMAEGTQTRQQKDMALLKKDVERVELGLAEVTEGIGAINGRFDRLEAIISQMMKKGDTSEPLATSVQDNVLIPTSHEKNPPELHHHHSLRLDFPKFNGDDFPGWLLKAKQYFETEQIPEDRRILHIMMNLKGKALQWHQHYSKTHGGIHSLRWPEYMNEMRCRFSDVLFTDPMSELVSLRQDSTVDEYYKQFESILNLLSLNADSALSIFMSNLRLEISKTMRLFQPQSLNHTYNLARQLESLIHAIPQRPIVPFRRPLSNQMANSISSTTMSPQPSLLPAPRFSATPNSDIQPRHLSLITTQTLNMSTKTTDSKPKYDSTSPTKQERDERRKASLCMWCADKFIPGHKCIKSKLYQLLVNGVIDDGRFEDPPPIYGASPEVHEDEQTACLVFHPSGQGCR